MAGRAARSCDSAYEAEPGLDGRVPEMSIFRYTWQGPLQPQSPALEVGVGLAGNGHEEGLAELVHAERPDDGLGLGRQDELREGPAPCPVHPRPVRRVDLHNRVDIEERLC